MADFLSFEDYDLENAQDPIAVDEGEYKIRIIECDGERENSSGNPYIMPRFEVVDEPLAKDFSHYMPLFYDGMDEKAKQRTRAALKNFCACFGIPMTGIAFDDLAGLEGWVLLGKKNDPEYGEQNSIRKFITGA